jgi:uncharacterized protein (DUF2267 family)
MKLTGLDVFDSTIQRTNTWLKELMQELNWSDHRKTYFALRAVMHAVRDHLSVTDAVYVGEQLPMMIRGFYFEHWNPDGKPLPVRSQNDFLFVLSSYMARDGENTDCAESVTRAVFRLLDKKATDGEIGDLQRVMPAGVIDLWPATLRAA